MYHTRAHDHCHSCGARQRQPPPVPPVMVRFHISGSLSAMHDVVQVKRLTRSSKSSSHGGSSANSTLATFSRSSFNMLCRVVYMGVIVRPQAVAIRPHARSGNRRREWISSTCKDTSQSEYMQVRKRTHDGIFLVWGYR